MFVFVTSVYSEKKHYLGNSCISLTEEFNKECLSEQVLKNPRYW